MNIAMTGATGFVGSRLRRALQLEGWRVIPLGRKELANPEALRAALEGADAVVNLAGAPILARWSEAYKKILYDSRVGTTRLLVEALGKVRTRPRLLISTSAVGIYREGGLHTELEYTLADGFLGHLASAWEQEAQAAASLGMRVAIFRFGIVLGAGGGALGAMLPAFRFGLGGPVGSGTQYISWIHIEDLAQAYIRALKEPGWEGVYNLTAPDPVTSAEFASALGRALKRPVLFRVPGFLLRLRYGEGASVMLEGQRALPERLLKEGFRFRYPDIGAALAECVSVGLGGSGDSRARRGP